jgi:flagellar biosynthetic protein FlhB
MSGNQGQERTERATPKRVQDARREGRIPRSRELNTLLMMLAASGGMLVFGGGIASGMANLMRADFQISRVQLFDTTQMTRVFASSSLDALAIIAPFMLLMLFVAVTAPMLLGGFSFSTEAIGVKWERLDPVKGFGRIFATHGLVELVKSMAKVALIGVCALMVLQHQAPALLGLSGEPAGAAMAHAMQLAGIAFLIMSASLAIVAIADVPFQLWEHARGLRMSRQEVRDETKDTEGKPEVRGRIRRLQQEVARRRMMSEVPKADVIVTNPAHYAVALRYDEKRMRAPRVVAKGAELVAARIREIGAEHRVPLLRAPVLARALYFNTDIGEEIPAGLYKAVAQVLAYVFGLRARNDLRTDVPESAFQNLDIPEELRK